MSSSGAKRQAQAHENAAKVQSDTSLQVAQLQYDAALMAAEMNMEGNLGAAHAIAGATAFSAELQFAAAQEAIAEQKRQYDLTTETLRPYVETGERFLPESEEASTFEGFQNRLTEIMDTDVFRDLRDERQAAASGALGQAGLTRSGRAAQAAADISTQLAMGIEGQDYARKVNQVNIGQAAAARQATVNMNHAGSVGAIHTGTAANVGSQMVQGAIAQGGFISQAYGGAAQAIQQGAYYQGAGMMGSANAIAGGMVGSANAYAQGSNQMMQMGMTAAATAASIYFSDERLKKNMQPIGKVKGLTLYEWDWIDQIKAASGYEMSIGFKAQDVEKLHPDCVATMPDGFKAINYSKLHERLAA